MPLYTYKCSSGHEVTRRRLYARRHEAIPCGVCSAEMNRVPIEALTIGHSLPANKPAPPESTGMRPTVVMRGVTANNNGRYGINIEGGVLDASDTTLIGNGKGALRARNAVVRMRNTKVE
jgi:hypothetical protein